MPRRMRTPMVAMAIFNVYGNSYFHRNLRIKGPSQRPWPRRPKHLSQDAARAQTCFTFRSHHADGQTSDR